MEIEINKIMQDRKLTDKQKTSRLIKFIETEIKEKPEQKINMNDLFATGLKNIESIKKTNFDGLVMEDSIERHAKAEKLRKTYEQLIDLYEIRLNLAKQGYQAYLKLEEYFQWEAMIFQNKDELNLKKVIGTISQESK